MTKNIMRAFQLAEEAKSYGDLITANEIFAALLKLHLLGHALFELEVESGDSEDPYYDLFVLRFPEGGEQCYLCIPRPLLVGHVAARFLDRATIVPRREHERVVSEKYDCSHALNDLRLDIPHDWLLPPNSRRSEWLTAEELDHDDRIAGASHEDWHEFGHSLACRQNRVDALGALLN